MFNTHSSRYRSSFSVRSKLFGIALAHSLNDAVHASVPVAIAGCAVSFMVWFWGDGPTDLMLSLFGARIDNPILAKILSTFLVGFPTAVFVRSSFVNFLRVISDGRAFDRDTNLEFERLLRDDAAHSEFHRHREEQERRGRAPG